MFEIIPQFNTRMKAVPFASIEIVSHTVLKGRMPYKVDDSATKAREWGLGTFCLPPGTPPPTRGISLTMIYVREIGKTSKSKG